MDFGQMLGGVKRRLAEAIKDREDKAEWVNPSAAQGRKVFMEFKNVPVNTNGALYDFAFAVHSDSTCVAIKSFLDNVTLQNITSVDGPRKGKLLGIDGELIPGLHIYKR